MEIIRVIDFETADADPPAEVVEVGWCDVYRDGELWEVGVWGSYLCFAAKIAPEARAMHHLSREDLAAAEPFDAGALITRARDDGVLALAAHNASFEAKWLKDWVAPVLGALQLLCTYKAAVRVWPEAPAHRNHVLRYWLEERGVYGAAREHAEPAHRAGPDAVVTAHLLRELLVQTTIADIAAWTAEPVLMPRIPIGPSRGKPWRDVELGFLSWMLRQPTMDADLKWNAQREIDRRNWRVAEREKSRVNLDPTGADD